MSQRSIFVEKEKILIKERRWRRNGRPPDQEKCAQDAVHSDRRACPRDFSLGARRHNLGEPEGIVRKKESGKRHSLVPPILPGDSRGADACVSPFLEEAPELHQRLSIQDDVGVRDADILARGGSHASIDGAPVADVSPGLDVLDSWLSLQVLLGAVARRVVHHGERKREGSIQALEKSGELPDAIQRVVDEGNIGRHDAKYNPERETASAESVEQARERSKFERVLLRQ